MIDSYSIIIWSSCLEQLLFHVTKVYGTTWILSHYLFVCVDFFNIIQKLRTFCAIWCTIYATCCLSNSIHLHLYQYHYHHIL